MNVKQNNVELIINSYFEMYIVIGVDKNNICGPWYQQNWQCGSP